MVYALVNNYSSGIQLSENAPSSVISCLVLSTRLLRLVFMHAHAKLVHIGRNKFLIASSTAQISIMLFLKTSMLLNVIAKRNSSGIVSISNALQLADRRWERPTLSMRQLSTATV